MMAGPVPFELVLRELRRHNFAVLSTTGEDGQPHAAGVTYGLSLPGRPLALFVMTRAHLQKARDTARNPQVPLVVPIRRRWLWFLPPATLQIRGRAEIRAWDDMEGAAVFRHFWLGRRIADAYRAARCRGEARICFLRIEPDPTLYTYMIGRSLWQVVRRIESGAGRAVVPPEYR